MSALVILAMAGAGGVGAVLRLVVDTLVGKLTRHPVGTLIINVSGSAALGVLTGIGLETSAADWLPIVGVGLLGGYTTFSTAMVETVRLWGDGRRRWAAVSSIGMMVAAVIAAGAGLAIGAWAAS